MSVISFKKANCKNCYRCIKVCPIKAIRFNDDVQAEIMPVDCVLCGHCLEACPQNAKTITSDVGKVKEMIRSGHTVFVSLAPSFLGSFDLPEPGSMVTALQKLGFAGVMETAEGAVQVSREYRKLITEDGMDNIITTCCPTVNDLIEKYYPSLVPIMAPVVSPMIAHGRMIKKQHEDAKVVFIGPCLSKKQEAEDIRHDTAIDAVLTFDELEDWFKEAGIQTEEQPAKPFMGADPAVARMYPITDGIINTVNKLGGTGDYQLMSVSGMKECMDLLSALQEGQIHHCFIEINACTGGCIYGPAISKERKAHRFSAQLDIKKYAGESEEIALSEDPELNLTKHMVDRSRAQLIPTEEQIREILRKIGKETPEQELNCGFCGYNSCREKAIAVFQNKAQLYMCLPYMNGLAQSMSNVILAESPNIIIAVDSELKICELNHAAETAFRITRSEALGHYLCEYIDADNFDYVLQTHNDIVDMRVSYPVYDIITEQSITYVPDQQLVIGIFRDVTEEQEKSQKAYHIKVDTVEMAQKVISKQMMVAQQIASLLGETTAETKATLTKLKDMIVYDGEEKQ